jgi:glucokinase
MPDNSKPAAVGVSVSSDRIRAVTIGADGNPTERFESTLDADSIVSEEVASVMVRIDPTRTSPICVAVPGMVDTGSQQIVDSRVPGMTGSDLRSGLETAGREVFVENDANAAAFAEYSIGAGKGSRNLFCVSLGEGVGSGLILNGEIWRGADGFAGEFGAIVVDEEGTRLEDIASMSGIVRRTRNRFHQDRTSTLRRLREDDISFHDILVAAEMGDDLALLMLERTGTFVGTALAAVINLLNIEKVVIAGEVIRTPSAVLDAVIRRTRECSSARAFNSVTIALSELDEFAAAIGAGLLALRRKQ